MAARRLIAILLVLLFLSSLAAALAPVQQSGKSVSTTSESSTTQSTTASPPQPDEATGSGPGLIEQSVDASRDQTPTIKARVGDQLQLRVTSLRPGTVELAGIGPTEDVGAEQPAFFDVLLREKGTYIVRFLGTEREIAQIEVAELRAQAPAR